MSRDLAKPNQRNYGIDLLRIVSMVMIVVLHVLGKGGILNSAKPLSAGYETAWFLEIASYCAVNCYALISGYVGINSKFKYSNIAYIWLQVAFYTVSITVAAVIFLPNIAKREILIAFFPVTQKYYWYFTAYFCIYFFTPLFNKMISGLSVKQLKVIAVTMLVIFSVIPIICRNDLFFTNGGYSSTWLALLYILGGIIRKCNILEKCKPYKLILLYLLFVTVTWGTKFSIARFVLYTGFKKDFSSGLVNYISPTIVLAAIALLIGFSRLKIGRIGAKIIGVLAPASFGVYLIHVHKYVWSGVMHNRFVSYASLHPVLLAIAVIATALAIYLLCAFVDCIRERIFKLLKIKKLLVGLETKIVGDLWSDDKAQELSVADAEKEKVTT